VLHIIGKIPKRVTVACSGGLDSVAVVDFLLKGKRKVDLLYFNHDTLHGRKAEEFVKKLAGTRGLTLLIGRVRGTRGSRSLEEFWRDERYDFFGTVRSPFIITCHHLDDAVETWLMSSFNGSPKLIPYHRPPNIYRPFLLTKRSQLEDYAHRKNLDWIDDPSNISTAHARNYVRHQIVPHVLKINPGIRKTIKKKLIEIYR